jgi:hypothetical protein
MLENTFWAGIVNESAFTDKAFPHESLTPGAEAVW